MKIPFLDWTSNHNRFKEEWLKDVEKIYDSGIFLRGPFTQRFEMEFGAYCAGSQIELFTAGVANGLNALTLSLQALELEPGHEVLVPGNTFIATVLSIIQAGLRPVLVPPDMRTYTIDTDKLDSYCSSRTRAIIPVHLYGRICEMSIIRPWAQKKGIKVIEDAAQAHGALLDGTKAGCFGDVAAFSFYPGKNLGALGDAGAVVTSSRSLHRKVVALGNYGSLKKYEHNTIGTNSRIDELQASFLIRKLHLLDEQLKHRRHIASVFLDQLPAELTLPPPDDDRHKSAWHLFVIRHTNRDRLLSFLSSKGIECLIHYPKSICSHNAFRNLKLNTCRNSVQLSCENLSLPIGPHIKQPQLEYIIKQVRVFFGT